MAFQFPLAALLSATVVVLHIFGGGRHISKPILNCNDLHPVVRLTNYYAWHLVSINLIFLVILFTWSAVIPSAWEAAAIATLMASSYSLLGIILVMAKRQKFSDMPQGLFFLPIACIGVWGLWA